MIEYITCAAAVVAACCSLIRVIGGATRSAEGALEGAIKLAEFTLKSVEGVETKLAVAIAALPKKRKPRAKPQESGEVTQ